MVDSNVLDELNSPEPEQRKRAIRQLARSQQPEALNLLSAAYRTETDPEIRDLVAKAGRYLRKRITQLPADDDTHIDTSQAQVDPEPELFDTPSAEPDYNDLSEPEKQGEISLETEAFEPIVEIEEALPPEIEVESGSSRLSIGRRVLTALEMMLVLGLSLLLLAYVGLGDASRTYPALEMDNVGAQGEIVTNAMQSFLLAGLPISQFPGFNTITQPIMEASESIYALYVTDANEQVIFANIRSGDLDSAAITGYTASTIKTTDKPYTIAENDAFYRTTLELRSKFETVGWLHALLPKTVIDSAINHDFVYVPAAAAILLVIFGVYVFIKLSHTEQEAGGRWLSLSYGLIFSLTAVIVIISLVNLYTTSIEGKTVALANSFSQRLNAPLELGVDLNEFGDLDSVFQEYQALNPDLSYVALTVDGQTTIHTDATLLHTNWQTPANHFAVSIPLERPNETAMTELHLGVPTNVIYGALWRSVKNFVVLFIAAGFLSLLFFRLMRSYSVRNSIEQTPEGQSTFKLGLISPFYFLTVLAEALASSFLPQYLKGMARTNGVDEGIVSTLFTVYFLSFVIALIPAGQYAERKGTKPLLLLGMMLVASSMLLMAFVNNIYIMFAVRALAGFGQGILLVAVQSFILQTASDKQKTRAAAIIVFGYNGGTISGAAIGALLVVSMQTQGVFILGAIIALFSLWYAFTLIPRMETSHGSSLAASTQSFMSRTRSALRDFEFVKAMVFIGIPAKAILTGVTVFALPLLLSQQNYAQEDIGQIIMLYAAGVLISSSYVSRLVDRIGKTTGILFTGTVGSGIGLILIGLAGWKPVLASSINGLSPAFLIVGMIVLGLAHGFIHAPIMTHISTTSAAEALGKTSATSLYRLLERIGHVSGPIIVSNLLLSLGDSLFTISWLGLITVAFGFLFLIRITGDRASQPTQVTTT